MDLFEAHRYLDPTTLDDSSFLSFSSFADLTRSPYEEYLAPAMNQKQHSRQSIQPQFLQPQSFGLYQSFELLSQPPVFSSPQLSSHHSDSGSESPSTPYGVSCAASSSYTPHTPAVNEFASFTSPSSSPLTNRGGPSKYSIPTTNFTPSHHVSHRSASSSSDWNSPVTPSLTYKSSVDSLASFAPEQDFSLPPSSTHTAYGWDDQSLGSSSSLTLRSPGSPPSPSPHRVASNPTLTKNRHPRSITQVKSLPSLREEGTSNTDSNLFEDLDLFDQFTNFDSLGDNSASQEWVNGVDQPSDIAGTMFETMNDLNIEALTALNDMCSAIDSTTSRGSVSDGMTSSSETTSIEQFLMPDSFNLANEDSTPLTIAQSLGPDLSSTSTATVVASNPNVIYSGWEPEQSIETPYNGQPQPGFSGNADCVPYSTTAQIDNVYRPLTAPEQTRQVSSSYSLALPARPMGRSVSSNAVMPFKSTDETYSHRVGQQQPHSTQFVSYPSLLDTSSIDPAVMGTWSTKPADLPESSLIGSRRSSHSLAVNVEAAGQHAMYQQQGQYAQAPMSAPFALQAQTVYGSVHPMNLQPESATSMKRVGSQPLPGARAQSGNYPMNFYQAPYNTTTQYPEAERQRIRAEVASRRVSMAEASVMQPWSPPSMPQRLVAYPPNGQQLPPHQYQPLPMQQQQQQQRPQYMGWEPESTTPANTQHAPQIQHRSISMGSGPVMTNAYAPLGNVHPPANSFHPNSNPNSRMQSAPVPHKVHPPSHPGSIASGSGSAGPSQQQRPIARLPSGSPAGRQSRKTPGSAKPKAPKTPGKKKNMPVSGVQEHGQLFFANYDQNDAETLLRGVAPSGSQSKRKREAAATASLSVPMAQASSGSDISGDEDSRSKRSRSNDSASGGGASAQ